MSTCDVTWHRGVTRKTIAAAVAGRVLLWATPVSVAQTPRLVSVIVREQPGGDGSTAVDVQRLGGHIGLRLGIIDGYKAIVPVGSVSQILSVPGITSVTPDAPVHLNHLVDGFDGATDVGSLYNLTKTIRAQDVWKNGYTGRGVDVALIDSGVVNVNGLDAPNKVVNGPYLSFE